ncbi:MAG: hypothetical protein H7256_10590 [Bdellovibrio sp.]|nr:hypothetical protein [Bdellovibrio sp.]
MKRLISLFFATSALSVAVLAQSSSASLGTATSTSSGENKASLSDMVGNKKFEENNEITDAKLKADAGSLSKYSLKFNLSYYGPTAGDLAAKDQPNPDGSVGSYETAISGSLGGRYRIDPKTTISMGSGLKLIHPFHGAERMDLNNPYLSYDMTNKMSGVQMRNSFGVSYITVPNYTKVGEFAGLSYDLSFNYDLGMSGFAVGLDGSLGYYLYKRDYVYSSDRFANRSSISLYPTLKYNISDKLNINTSPSLSYVNYRMNSDELTFVQKTVSQRVGVGYAFSRDIYIAPYINFYPDRWTPDATTLNISSSFSLL